MNISRKIKGLLAVAAAAMGTAAVAAPKVTIDKIEDGDVWSTKKVIYTISDVPAADGVYVYNLAFDVTAYSVTTNIKMGVAQNGQFTNKLDTAAIFGVARKDPKAKIRVSVEKGWDLTPVQLWEGGPFFAKCNVGASAPHEAGYYFWWGDTVGYVRNSSNDGWVSVKDGSAFSFGNPNCPTYNKENEDLYNLGFIDATSANAKLKPEYDAATKHLGPPWRMPTRADLVMLFDKCRSEWVDDWEGTGISGRILKGDTAGYTDKRIFVPAVGWGGYVGYDPALVGFGTTAKFWSSTPCDSITSWAQLLDDWGFHDEDCPARYYGLTVRAVRDFAE